MTTYDDLTTAQDEHRERGGVLLVLGENHYAVATLEEAVDARHGSHVDRYDEARYWAALGEFGYDESDPLFRRVRTAGQ